MHGTQGQGHKVKPEASRKDRRLARPFCFSSGKWKVPKILYQLSKYQQLTVERKNKIQK